MSQPTEGGSAASAESGHRSERVVVLAPTAGDAEVCRRFLAEAAIEAETHEDGDSFCEAIRRPAGALVITEEELRGQAGQRIRDALGEQEAWSALPLLLLAGAAPQAAMDLMVDYESHGRVILVERPVKMSAFLTSVRMALIERRQQYRIRDLLEERNARIAHRDDFLATLGHELRNPLAAIVTCAELLKIAPPDSEQTLRARDIIADQAQQLKRLIDDIVDVSRLTRRKLALQPEPVDLRQILNDVAAQVGAGIRRRSQTLHIETDAAELALVGDPTRLRQVFANLLHNASRYSPEGGRIAVTAQRRGAQAVVRVRDEGIGMTPQTMARIFDPFFQCQDAGGGSREGLGVGLALAKSLVERHAGSIAASSAGPGRGSEFEVVLPLSACRALPGDSEQAPTEALPSDNAGPPTSRRILLIDDNVDFSLGLQFLLSTLGHDVQVAHEGTEGLRAAQRLAPDVVLIDICLPGLDGYEVARRLRGLNPGATPRLIAITGYRDDHDRRRRRLAGIDAYLIKPIDLAELQAEMAGGARDRSCDARSLASPTSG